MLLTGQGEGCKRYKYNITSLNVEGLASNHAFVNMALSNQHIICLQEHWIYSFDKHLFATLLPKWSATIRCSDEYRDDISNESRPATGRGGVAILWHHDLSPFIKRSDEGNARIILVFLDLPKYPVCIINCYLPSGNSKEAMQKYREDIDMLYELINKYKDRYDILLAGDLNEDHANRNNKKEKIMRELISALKLEDLGLPSQNIPTYVNHDLGHSSHIDQMLVKRKSSAKWSQVSIMDAGDPGSVLNSSSHCPISVKVEIEVTTRRSKQDRLQVKVVKYKWAEMDCARFSEVIDEEIRNYKFELMGSDSAVRVFQNIIKTATLASTPMVTIDLTKKKGKILLTPELKEAIKASKQKHFLWKNDGKPGPSHPSTIARKIAKRRIRSVQRRQEADRRRELLVNISAASLNDQRLFHRLVNMQRNKGDCGSAILVQEEIITDRNAICAECAEYFQKLATPSDELDTTEDKLIEYMRTITCLKDEKIQVSSDMVAKVIKQMKRNKAQDIHGLAAEHLKALSPLAIEILTNILNQILACGKIPQSLKSSYKIPIPKKGKDSRLLDNYRGITIAPIMSKTLELICLDLGVEKDMIKEPSGLQFGFTAGLSPCMASLVLSETAAEARLNKCHLYVASLDARKAFDVVNHSILKTKMYHSNLRKPLWSVIDDLYVNGKEVIRWEGEYSNEYPIQQGVKQGGVLSPTLYKLYVNNLLNSLKRSRLGTSIGTIYSGVPTCADDILLLSQDPVELQAMLDMCYDYSIDHKYQLHPTKSVVNHFCFPRNHGLRATSWYLGTSEVSVNNTFTHLGLDWKSGKAAPDMEGRVSAARRSAYSLLGVGLHGHNGLDPGTCMSLIQAYIVPRLLHGLEATVPSRKDMDMLDLFYRKLLRQIQGLPESTATEAVYLLLGAIPIEAVLHKRALSLFGNISRLEQRSSLWLMAQRQLSLRAESRGSWFAHLTDIGMTYGIDLQHVFRFPWKKLPWKHFCKQTIEDFWRLKLIRAAAEKSSLQWYILDRSVSSPYKPNPLWECCAGKPFQVGAATHRARLLVGRHQLRCTSWRQVKGESPKCPLCETENEDIIHFLVDCVALKEVRKDRLSDLLSLYTSEQLPTPVTPEEICSAVLNGDSFRISRTRQVLWPHYRYVTCKKHSKKAHQLANLLCYKLATERDIKINNKIINSMK